MGWSFTWRVDWVVGLLPLRLLGVDVDEEPLAILGIPYCFPAFGDFGWRRALWHVSLAVVVNATKSSARNERTGGGAKSAMMCLYGKA